MRERVNFQSRGVAFSSLLALGVALAGCTGMVAGSDNGNSVNNNGPMGSGGTGTNNPAGGNAGSTTNPGGGAAGTDTTTNVPGVSLMHRLNTAEYNATVADVLGTKLQPATVNWRGGEVDGFDNIAAVLGMNDDQYGLYVDAAETLALDVFANDATKAKVLTCATTDDMACVKTIIQQTGLRVFRRPILDAEVDTYTKVYKTARAQGEDHATSVKEILWALLSSAEFLYRMEYDNGVTTDHPVTGYELASRLSYFLWSSAPDDAMLAAGANLNNDAAIDTTVTRMITDPKSARLVTNFAGQWLGAREVGPHAVDKPTYPTWSPDIANAAATEMYSYFDEFLRKDLPWTDFLKKDLNFVTPALASLYGITGVTGTTSTRVEAFAGDNRAGFMSLVGFLTVSSVAARSSPTLRGKWVLVNLLCAPPPPPPPGVPKLEDGNAKPESTNVRAVLEAHRSAAGCKACHSVIDPYGLAMEQYDGIGQFRTQYPDKSTIDPSTTLIDGTTFAGLQGAEDATAKDPRFQTCITEKLYTYGLGRSLSTDDKAKSAAITQTWQGGGQLTVSKLLHALTASTAFRNRTAAQ